MLYFSHKLNQMYAKIFPWSYVSIIVLCIICYKKWFVLSYLISWAGVEQGSMTEDEYPRTGQAGIRSSPSLEIYSKNISHIALGTVRKLVLIRHLFPW